MSYRIGETVTARFDSLPDGLRIFTSSGAAPSEEAQLAQELLAILCSELLDSGEQTSVLSSA